MKIRLKAIILIALVALIVPILLGYSSSFLGAHPHNYVDEHADSKSYNNSECVACHTTLVENGRDTEGGNTTGAHRKHFLTVFLNFVNNYSDTPTITETFGCAWCHQRTVFDGVGISNAWTGASGTNLGWGQGLEGDLSYLGTDTVTNGLATDTIPPVRNNVDPAICLDCHGQATSPPTHAAWIAGSTGTISNCGEITSCHDASGPPEVRIQDAHASSNSTSTESGVWGIDQRYANSFAYCLLCHGGQVLYQQEETTGTW